jgi:NADPH-dependent glutamate synthase beta subunit-like oxidoreductase
MTLLPKDLTPVSQNTIQKGAGAVRWQRPVYADHLPPCNRDCGAGENIQAWLSLAQAGAFEAAWRKLAEDNPLPSAHGRACYHPCEAGCNRKHLDQPVSIHAVERFLGDLATRKGWQVAPGPATGKRVLVVGAGPGGLSCAYHLRRMGHAVEIKDAMPKPGGMMHYGIPAYRLPRSEVIGEIARIEAMGVRITQGHRIEDLPGEMSAGRFDACFLAIGAHVGNHLDIPAADGRKMVDAIRMFEQVEAGRAPQLGRIVAVVGGGNTAMDAARTAKRLGAEEVILVYRRDRSHIRADPYEVDEAFLEGVKAKWLAVPKVFDSGGLTIEEIELQSDGSLMPTGRMQTLPTESMILALGQHADVGFLSRVPGIAIARDSTIVVDRHMMTGHPGIFAGGDAIGGARTMTAATGHGKKAARMIDAWLRGQVGDARAKNPVVSFEMLNLPLFLDADRSRQRELPPHERADFAEIVAGLDEKAARYEAQRCLSCGNCFECDNCYAACPEDAIIKLGAGRRYRVDYDLCTGCATCYEQCPCHAIEMVAEPADSPKRAGGYGAPLLPGKFRVRR